MTTSGVRAATSPSRAPARLFWILGATNLCALVAQAALSWVEAGAATYASRPAAHLVFFGTIADWVSAWLPLGWRGVVRSAVGGQALSADWFIPVYATPLVLSSAVTIGALVLIARSSVGNSDELPDSVWRWGVAGALVMGCAVPVLVSDFWLPIAHGRAALWGHNPYYFVPDTAAIGLPLDAPIEPMTYGPLLTLVAWAIAFVTGGGVFGAAILFKALAVTTWIGILALVRALVAGWTARDRSMALVTIGWLPLGVVQVPGDGHTDGLMMIGVLAWLWLGHSGRRRLATAALAASVAVKYVTAPLFVLDLLWVAAAAPGASLWQRFRSYLPHVVVASGLWVMLFAPFFRSLAFFAQTRAVSAAGFFRPFDAVVAIGHLVGLNLRLPGLIMSFGFGVIAALAVVRYWTAPTRDRLHAATTAVMLPVLFVASRHVWPWYVLWLAIPAAVMARGPLQRWSMGVYLTAPFTLLVWTAHPGATNWWRFDLPTILAYGGALAWMVIAARWLERPSEGR